MPTAHREQGFEVRIYPADHHPPHVHVVKAGTAVKIALGDEHHRPEIMAVYSMSPREVLRAFRLVEGHQEQLLKAWREYHGEETAE